jgi:phenylalanyl-tRNA synthetase alpha chain
MLETVKELLQEVNSFNPKSEKEVEFFRLKFLGKKGKLNELFADFKSVPNESKKEFGQVINMLKQNAQAKVDTYKGTFETESNDSEIDLTRPVSLDNLGSRHPISLARNQIVDIFNRIGFTVSEGPEIEDDWHNFTALNLPEEHPARDMQDTFFIQTSPDVLLRTHTSSVQVRYMQENKPPIRTLSAGRVYRNEAISARAHCIFHQIEGLYINKNVSFADLKQALLYFAKEMFGEKTKIRLRPSFFPFTEPSAEVDVSCNICNSKGCNVCKYTGYLEILGCGMVDPNVLENCGIDSKKYTGYAFGMGVERIAMLKYGVKDLRLFFENDVRFLKQFDKSI